MPAELNAPCPPSGPEKDFPRSLSALPSSALGRCIPRSRGLARSRAPSTTLEFLGTPPFRPLLAADLVVLHTAKHGSKRNQCPCANPISPPDISYAHSRPFARVVTPSDITIAEFSRRHTGHTRSHGNTRVERCCATPNLRDRYHLRAPSRTLAHSRNWVLLRMSEAVKPTFPKRSGQHSQGSHATTRAFGTRDLTSSTDVSNGLKGFGL
jgi:hypothetical protein